MRIKVNINVKVGRVVKYFVISDFFLLAGWGLIDPVFSVFIIQRVLGGTLMTVGIAAAIYWIIRSVAQIPIAEFLDRIPGEHDDFMALVGGLLLVGISAIAMCWVTRVWELYALSMPSKPSPLRSTTHRGRRYTRATWTRTPSRSTGHLIVPLPGLVRESPDSSAA